MWCGGSLAVVSGGCEGGGGVEFCGIVWAEDYT